jgi:hypothetical protein
MIQRGESPLSLINPLSRRNIIAETLNGGYDTISTLGGIPFSILSGDAFNYQNVDNIDVSGCVVTFNGIGNSIKNGYDMNKMVYERMGRVEISPNRSKPHIKNATYFAYLGDVVQIIGNELTLTDITAIRGAAILRKMAEYCRCITVIAHSQGTMTFRMALGLIDNLAIRKKICFHGYGGEYFANSFLGLGGYENVWNKGDLVPYSALLPTPAKILDFAPGAWRNVDSGFSGFRHRFENNYFQFVPRR